MFSSGGVEELLEELAELLELDLDELELDEVVGAELDGLATVLGAAADWVEAAPDCATARPETGSAQAVSAKAPTPRMATQRENCWRVENMVIPLIAGSGALRPTLFTTGQATRHSNSSASV